MKKQLMFLLVSLIGTLCAAEPLVWNKDNNFDGWTHFLFAKGTITDGNLKLTDIKFDCRVENIKVSVDPEKFNTFSYRYRAKGTGSTGGEFFFCHGKENCSDKRQWNLPPLIADGEWHTVSITPQDLKSWIEGGIISSLRFDPTNSPGGEIEISEIRLEKRDIKPVEVVPGKVPMITRWDKNNEFTGWGGFISAKGQISDGMIKLTDIKPDCYFSNGNTNIDPSKYNAVTYRYRASGTGPMGGEIYYRHGKENFTDNMKCNTPPLIADGKWHTITAIPLDMDSWTKKGIITGLRIDPTNSPGGETEISEIYLDNKWVPKVTHKLDAPVWPEAKSELWKTETAHLTGPYFEGKMIRSPEDKLEGGKYKEFYLRRTFNLKEKPVQGWLQFTADDCASVSVNGKNAGYANDWRSVLSVDVTRYLAAGKNVIAFHYLNQMSYGGILAELYIQYADNSVVRINTDHKFVCGTEANSGWDQINFDDSKWAAAIEQNAPPAFPWKIRLPYRFFKDMQKIVHADIMPRKVQAGDIINITLDCEGRQPNTDIPVSITLKEEEKLIWKENLLLNKKYFIPGEGNCWKLSFPYQTPLYVNSCKVNVSLESDMFAVQKSSFPGLTLDITRIKADPGLPLDPVCQVVKENSTARFTLNGKPVFWTWLWGGDKKNTSAPLNLVSVYPNSELWWPRSDVLETSVLDYTAELYRRKYPDAYFMWDISMYVPNDWSERNPQEMCMDEFGKINKDGRPNHSYSSPKAQHDFEEMLVKVIHYLEQSPYANRIIGYRISGGHTIEWLGWDSTSRGALDFAPCAQKAFADFVQQKYPTIRDTSVPKAAERQQMDEQSQFWDQQKHLRSIAYFDFTSNQVADQLIKLCQKAKSIVGARKVVGSYYGYTSTLHYTGNSQMRAHYALKKLLDSGTVDFLMSPNSYPLRNLGDTCGEMKPFRTMQMNGIVPVCEDDTRTHNNFDITKTPGSKYQMINEKQTVNVLRRNMGIAICRNQPNYYLPIFSGKEIDFPAMAENFAIMRTVGQYCLDRDIRRNAEIALVVSEESIKAMPCRSIGVASGILDQYYKADGTVEKEPRIKELLTYESFVGNQERFARTGAPVDQLLAEDLSKNPGNYKLYVFINCYVFDEAFRQAVAKLQQRKCVLLWLYAPGYIQNHTSGNDNMKKLTGFTFEKMDSPIIPAVKLKDGRTMGTPSAKVTPMFAVKTPGVEVLGTYENDKVGIAAMKTGKALSVFSGAWQLDIPFMVDMMNQAGVYRYAQGTDPMECNDSLVVIHARFPGKKIIDLPRKTNVLDVFAGKIIAYKTNRIESDFALHETKFFYYGDDADELLQKLSSLRRKIQDGNFAE